MIQRKTISFELLKRFDANGENFLSKVVTGGDTWGHNFELRNNTINGMALSVITTLKEF